MVRLAEDDGHSWILKASAERARQAEDEGRVQEITSGIAERRGRDLMDFLAVIEQRECWPVALDCLRSAFGKEYSIPMGTGGYHARLEPLKYREMAFELFSCSGLEPVNCDTMILLDELEDEKSLVSATSRFRQRTEALAVKQVAAGDMLFFDFSDPIFLSEITPFLERAREAENRTIRSLLNGGITDLGQLWLTETGRRVLSELGVRGSGIQGLSSDVLQVIQTLLHRLSGMIDQDASLEFVRRENRRPLNETYSVLLQSIMDQDEETLRSLGSKCSVPTFNTLLYCSLASYHMTESSDSYRQLVRSIGNHVIVRALHSIPTIGKLARVEDNRISTLAITALGSFYHESAASTLIDITCETTSKELVGISLSALDNITKKCPEARHLVSRVIHSQRPNRGRLKNLYRAMPHGLPAWYHWE